MPLFLFDFCNRGPHSTGRELDTEKFGTAEVN